MNIILFDSDARNHLLPLTATRPMGELRVGILTFREKWERLLRGSASYITQEYLQEKFPIHIEDENVIVNAGILPNEKLSRRIGELTLNEALLYNGELVAARINEAQFEQLIEDEEVHSLQGVEVESNIPIVQVNKLWELTLLAKQAIPDDFALLTGGRKSQPVSSTNRVVGPLENLFLEEGAVVECAVLNTTGGPIYIGKNAEVMEGSLLRGPVSIGAGAIVKLGAKIYGPTSIGPNCRVGGEVTRSIMLGNSNKAHDGFLGDAVLGEWCHIGADTNNSNLKNNYG